MNEEIYTIPVMDGFNAGTECPFCAMYRKLEADSINFVLSPSYMEEDVRGETNEKGFCKLHMKQLYDKGNSLGLALMMHSHLKHRMSVLESALPEEGTVKKGWFSKKDAGGSDLPALRKRWQESCYICDRIEDTFRHFLKAFFLLWHKNPEFRDKVKEAPGYCLDHFLALYDAAGGELKGKALEEFRRLIADQEKENLTRVADDIEWFTLKFDYRYQDKPWKNSKDALPRTILKVNGQFVEKNK